MKIKTPISDFLTGYAERGTVRFHMPGHKGKSVTGIERYDITEVAGADVLYSADGIIAESEGYAKELFNTGATFYSSEGATLAIKAMVKLVTDKDRTGGETPLILAGRNAHKSFMLAVALCGIDAEWIYPEKSAHLSACEITPENVEQKLSKMERTPSCVYVTSPDYLGNILDIGGISKVCKRYGVPLIVDNAHGAYLNFLEPSLHPIALGAAMCADSAHKTLPALTGAAYLHISKDYPEYTRNAEGALSIFASTSPSYLILRSLDLCNAELCGTYPEELKKTVQEISLLKEKIQALGFSILPTEPLKITLSPLSFGYTGTEIAEILRDCGIEAEFSDNEYTVLMITPYNEECELERLYTALASIKRREPIAQTHFPLFSGEKRMTIRDAIFAQHETVEVDRAVGRICAAPAVSCPPAVPIAVSGEVITEEAVELFKKYGIHTVEAVK